MESLEDLLRWIESTKIDYNSEFVFPVDIMPSSPRTPSSSTAEMTPIFGPESVTEQEWKLPAERCLDLMHLGFSFDEVKQIADLFDQYKEIMKPHNPNLTLNQVLTLFANFISISIPDNLKLLSYSFNLLEMGYSRQEVARLLVKERKRFVLDTIEMEMKPKRPRSSLAVSELPSAESCSSSRETTNGNQSDDEASSRAGVEVIDRCPDALDI
ncbi:hypothetical protein KIN20_028063 [Parelaphostrongylus tenuis]|uniref:Uncharacterized protein n=1 Tax=Parelaphostrongylus tenuis TaxID=148309 RepID=A0AAD5R0V9_PARTN|nr:hypothetical protein KIN20_028063 [Parelaphostrongylus tenuis]